MRCLPQVHRCVAACVVLLASLVACAGTTGDSVPTWDGDTAAVEDEDSGRAEDTATKPDPSDTGCKVITWYRDRDGDRYGDDASTIEACWHPQPEGYVMTGGDCDDTDPSAWEIVSGYPDADGDGYGDGKEVDGVCSSPSDYADDAGDCDDADPTVYPDAEDVCEDGVDADCDGVDEVCPELIDVADIANGRILGEKNTWIGSHTAGLGDINGDGRQGVFATTWSGPGYLFLGVITGDVYTTSADAEVSTLGATVGIGDVNADGYEDALAIAGLDEQFHLLYGPLSSYVDVEDEAVGLVDDVSGAGNYSVRSIDAAGDLDDDGHADLLVGTAGRGLGIKDEVGHAAVFYGALEGTQYLSEADVLMQEEDPDDMAGAAVAGDGDLDGDGVGDVLVGAYNAGDAKGGKTSYASGKTYVLLGPLSGSLSLSTADHTLRSSEAAGTGVELSIVGDTDGDGYDDFLVASYNDDHVYLVRGPVTIEDLADAAGRMTLSDTTQSADDNVVAGLGDLNGDGRMDFGIGNHEYVTDSYGEGNLSVFLGPVSGSVGYPLDGDVAFAGSEKYAALGGALDAAGDVDDDGLGDIVVSSSGLGAKDGTATGAAYLILGASLGL